MDYYISEVYMNDSRRLKQIDALLEKEGIRRDNSLDYICAMYDEDGNIAATGSCYGNTLRCFAVSSDHQSEPDHHPSDRRAGFPRKHPSFPVYKAGYGKVLQ